MRVLLWGCRIFVFLFLLAFALKNSDPVSVRFFFDAAWQAPLVIIVLAFFAGGAVLGVLSLLGTVFGLRREVSRLKREAKQLEK
jgi:lipopolysaccharide assembly protein A